MSGERGRQGEASEAGEQGRGRQRKEREREARRTEISTGRSSKSVLRLATAKGKDKGWSVHLNDTSKEGSDEQGEGEYKGTELNNAA